MHVNICILCKYTHRLYLVLYPEALNLELYIINIFFRSLKHILLCILNDCMIFHFVAMTCLYHSRAIYLVWLLLIQNSRQNMFLAFRFKGGIICFISVCTCVCMLLSADTQEACSYKLHLVSCDFESC